jgi:hypothetical protein
MCQEILYVNCLPPALGISSNSVQVPPKGEREQVPLGSSSLSMYPGYSPEDIQYGKASMEAGQAIGEMRKRGEEWQPSINGPEYTIGHGHGTKRKPSVAKENPEAEDDDIVMTDSPAENEEPVEENEDTAPAFFIDKTPKPVEVNISKKRALEDDGEGSAKKPSKKSKQAEPIVIEQDDITEAVKANLKAKEAKALAKIDKKKRRVSSGDEASKAYNKSKKQRPKEGSENSDGEGKKKKKSKSSE